MDPVLFDTLVVAWVLAVALYFFALGRAVGRGGLSRGQS